MVKVVFASTRMIGGTSL